MQKAEIRNKDLFSFVPVENPGSEPPGISKVLISVQVHPFFSPQAELSQGAPPAPFPADPRHSAPWLYPVCQGSPYTKILNIDCINY